MQDALAAEGEPPKLFSFLDLYKKGTPPSVGAKLKAIRDKANQLEFKEVGPLLDQLFRSDIRNAFFHSDYVLYQDRLRLKHRGDQIDEIPLQEVFALTQRAVDFVQLGLALLQEERSSFGKHYVIQNRKNKDGVALCSIKVLTDDAGLATGFSTSDPLPLW